MRRSLLLVAVSLSTACVSQTVAPLAAKPGSFVAPLAQRPWAALTPLERAQRATGDGAVESVARVAWDARGSQDDSAELRAVGAFAALAVDCADEAIELASDSNDPALLRVIVRAHVTRDRWADAALVAARPELTGDEDAAFL